MKMEIARLYLTDKGRTKAFCDLQYGDLLIKGLRVVAGAKGLFVSMPRKRGENNLWYEAVMPLTHELRIEISQIVIEAYEAE